MNNFKTVIIILFLIINVLCVQAQAQLYKIISPDGSTEAQFRVDGNGVLQYLVKYQNKQVISWSQIGLDVVSLSDGFKNSISKTSTSKKSESFKWSFGEKEYVVNKYNELTLSCQSGKLRFDVLVRMFDGSLAFKYQVPDQLDSKDLIINKELTSFNFNKSYTIYQYHHESVFTPVKIDSLINTCDFPATLSNGKLYISIGEAENTSYTKAELGKGINPSSLNVLFARDKVVKFTGAFESPWRTVSFSNSAIGLHKYSDLFLRLNPPPSGSLPTGIQPGKLIRAQLNTQSGLDCIDLAKKLSFRYIMFDAGWYGPERALTSDPRVVIPQIDMPQIIKYGRDNGIGVILYVNYLGLQNHLDEILPLYRQWGVAGMKFGFIDGFSQKGISWLINAIKKVNDYGFVLNIHDNYKPTGLSRTYPALLSQEGIRGDENSPDAFHTTVLPFTRFLAGAADFTFCFPNPKNDFGKNLKVSKAQQLALTVIYYSPLQAIFWYGKPEDYTNINEFEFFKHVPTVWDETHYLKGDIGKNISVARRKGTAWFVGNAAGFEDWNDKIKLDFLTSGSKYTATVFADENNTISKKTLIVKKGDVFKFNIPAKGGQAIMIEILKR
jgi:alpha-glucosidase